MGLSACALSCIILLAGCSSQIKITQISGEARPELIALAEPIEATVAIVPRERVEAGKTKRPYASNAREVSDALAARLRDLKAFKAVYYPINADIRPDTVVEIEAQFYVDPHLGEAKATGFGVGLTLYAAAPAARIRVTAEQKARMTMTGVGKSDPREFGCSYEARFNPFGNVNANQAGRVLGQNIVQHVADTFALHVIRAHKPEYRAPSTMHDRGP